VPYNRALAVECRHDILLLIYMNAVELLSLQRAYVNSRKLLDVNLRIEILNKLKKVIKEHQTEILEALYKDLGKSHIEAYSSEISFVYEEIEHIVKNLKDWVRPKKVPSPVTLWPARSEIHYEPYGVSLIISPWN